MVPRCLVVGPVANREDCMSSRPERVGTVLGRLVDSGDFSPDATRAIRDGIQMAEAGELPPRPSSEDGREEEAA